MFRKIASSVSLAVSSLVGTPDNGTPVGSGTPAGGSPRTGSPTSSQHTADHSERPDPHVAHAKDYCELADTLEKCDVPVSHADCSACDAPCATTETGNGNAGRIAEIGNAWDGKTYAEYVAERYGRLGELPAAVDTDWETELNGSAAPPVGRIVVISTGKSNWVRDHTDEKTSLAYQLNKVLSKQPSVDKPKPNPTDPSTYIRDSEFPPPSSTLTAPVKHLPALYSSSLITQSDDPEDEMTIIFPDWKVSLEVENSLDGAKALWDGALAGTLGRAGRPLTDAADAVERRRSYVLPYRAIVLLCSHKTRDKRCHIAASVLRPAFIDCLERNGIAVDESGASLARLPGPPIEEIEGTTAEREAEVGRQIEDIEGVHGGEGGEVGLFNINHLGGHRYAGVMLILFPSGAYLSYGRVSPHEVPRIVEETILQGRIVPGLLRAASGVTRKGTALREGGILSW